MLILGRNESYSGFVYERIHNLKIVTHLLMKHAKFRSLEAINQKKKILQRVDVEWMAEAEAYPILQI